jgi:hypothetical protein
MFIDKQESVMMQESKTLERRGLAKGLKVWLDFLFYLTLLAAFLVIVLWPILSVFGEAEYLITVPVAVSEGGLLPPDVIDGLRFRDARGKLSFSLPGFFSNAVFWHLSVVLGAAGIYGLALLRKILRNVAQGFPFHPDNPRRLNHLGWIIVATSLLATVSQFLFGRWALSRLDGLDLPFSPTYQGYGDWILCGLLILVLASIWKQAVQIAEDQSLTV